FAGDVLGQEPHENIARSACCERYNNANRRIRSPLCGSGQSPKGEAAEHNPEVTNPHGCSPRASNRDGLLASNWDAAHVRPCDAPAKPTAYDSDYPNTTQPGVTSDVASLPQLARRRSQSMPAIMSTTEVRADSLCSR